MTLLKGPTFLKAVALSLAVMTYFFVHNEINNSEKKSVDPSYKLIKLTAKNLPVKIRLASSAPDGYQIDPEGVVANPESVIVVGPEALLEEASSAETALVDVSENTRTVAKKIPLESVSGIHLTGDPYDIEVIIPIHKAEGVAEPEKKPASA